MSTVLDLKRCFAGVDNGRNFCSIPGQWLPDSYPNLPPIPSQLAIDYALESKTSTYRVTRVSQYRCQFIVNVCLINSICFLQVFSFFYLEVKLVAILNAYHISGFPSIKQTYHKKNREQRENNSKTIMSILFVFTKKTRKIITK